MRFTPERGRPFCHLWAALQKPPEDHVKTAALHNQKTKTCLVYAGLSKPHCPASNAVFELGEVSGTSSQAPRFGELLVRRPVAAAALVPNSVILFSAGAVAGALGMAPVARLCLTLLYHSAHYCHSSLWASLPCLNKGTMAQVYLRQHHPCLIL